MVGFATSPSALAKAHAAKVPKGKVVDPVVYDSIIDPNPGNVPSQSFEANGVAEFGNEINLSGTARVLDNVVVQMSSWACQSGSWTGSPSACSSTSGATFSLPITFNVYNVGPASSYGPSTVGNLIATATQTFAIPYRPSADPVDCPSTPTEWYDAGLGTCFNGYFNNIEFNFGHVVLPGQVIYGITFNTNTAGWHPLGVSGPWDSLNVALSKEPSAPSVGSDAYPGTVYWAIATPGYYSNYCDSGAAGVNVFRIDEPANYPTGNGTTSGCWSANGNHTSPWYIPAVQFNAVNNPSPTITSPDVAMVTAGQSFSFTVTTTGVPSPTVSKAGGRLPKGLVLTRGIGTATISGMAPKTDVNKVYTVVVQAKTRKFSVARQRLMLTLTGGKG
jgi:hypothetical protein